MITIKGISKKFQNDLVLDDVDLQVNDGEIVGLVGPNGAGKTTLLNIVAGVWLPTEGTVELNGYDINKDSLKAHSILGYVPDTPFLYPKLTGREFLEFVGSLFAVKPDLINKKLSELEKALELGNWLDELMEGFPRGVRQKITIAAMLLHSPSILLLDEPTANLDPKSARLFKELLVRLSKKGLSILLSTHILEIAEKLCQRLIILDKGKVVALGNLEQLRLIAKSPDSDLERIFFELTAGGAYKELLEYLSL